MIALGLGEKFVSQNRKLKLETNTDPDQIPLKICLTQL